MYQMPSFWIGEKSSIMERVGNIIKKFVTDYGLESGLPLTTIKNQWAMLVGQTLAAHTSPDMIKGKTIFIIVDTPQWMHHVSFYRQEILEKLKDYRIDKVRFKLGMVDKSPVGEYKKTNHYELSEEDLTYIENTIGSLKDNELKEKFRILLLDVLSHKKRRNMSLK